VDKDRFLFIVRHYTALNEQEAVQLAALEDEYPYSQLIKNLATRAAQDNRLDVFQQLLQKSAVYCFDRSLLKQLLSAPRTEAAREFVSEEAEVAIPVQVLPYRDSLTHTDELIDALFHDMARLKEVKHHFEEVVEEYDKVLAQRRERNGVMVETATKPLADEDGLLEQIKSSKKEVDLSNVASVEQHQIIDQFIRSSPTLGKGKESSSGDLAEMSAAFGDHIISETLVEILLKQGKKEKAIEVLRKLIWKFPQKKAIFAALINDLKK